jgi:mannose-1-phosphate guanylyltransferase
MADLYCIILAGGASSRFWPLSGDEHPKYLLKPDGDRTLIELAWRRAAMCTQTSRIVVVTADAQAHMVREALPDLDASMLCVEPARRDTAAAIALGCKRVFSQDSDADVLVLPADTLLEPPDALAQGVKLARVQTGYRDAIHIFAVNPARAEGGFGYIEPGEEIAPGVIKVRGFKEKPGPSQAVEFAKRGYLWNVGCFLFSLATFDRELRKHLPQHSTRLRPVVADQPTEADYELLDSISIDFGVIEKVDNLRAVRLDAAFDDIGTWDALLNRLEKSGRGPGQAISVGGAGNVAAGEATSVAVVGESNLLIVVSGGNVLVLNRGHGQDVKKIGK